MYTKRVSLLLFAIAIAVLFAQSGRADSAQIVITGPPTNQAACVGDTVVFSVIASGTPLTFQWFKASTSLTGQTNNTLVLTNVTVSDAAIYKVKLIGATNSLTNSASLTVNLPVSATPLLNMVRAIGAPAVFGTIASGTGPFSYSWLKDNSIIAGQTNSTLSLSNVGVDATGTYTVIIGGACGFVTNSGTLTVAPCFSEFDVMLVIDRSGSMVIPPSSKYVDARSACTNFVRNLHLGATNDQAGLVSFNPTSTLDHVLTTNQAPMEAAISALPEAIHGTCISCGLLTGQAELASPRHRPDALPILVLLSDGIPHDFDTPSNALFNATQIKNAGTRIFSIGLGSDVDPVLMSGIASSTNDYFFANDSSDLSTIFDAISTLICRPPTNIFGPSDVTVCAGANVGLSVAASGCSSFTYQWLKNGQPLPGQTNSSISFSNVTGTNSGIYSVAVVGTCRHVTNSATLTVNEPAAIVAAPASQTSFIGSNVVFSVSANGTHLSYEWRFNGDVVSTSNTLALHGLTAASAGTYSVVVSSPDCGGPVTNSATLTLLNRAPLGADDSYSTEEDTPLTVSAPGVLANDSDPDGNSISAVLVQGPSHGNLILNSDGSFTYTPAPDYNGSDSFTYRASDGDLMSGLIVVILTVTPVNDTPVAVNDDRYVTMEDTLLDALRTGGVLTNDFDVDGDTLVTILVSTTTNGLLSLDPDGGFRYLPATNFHGEDHFTYRVTDGQSTSVAALVTIAVLPVNDGPVARDDSYSLQEDSALEVSAPGVLINDTDADGDTLTAILVTGPAHGTLTFNTNGSFTFIPATNYHGADSFTYVATDGFLTSTATVYFTIESVNDTPIANNDGGPEGYGVFEDHTLVIDAPGVLANDSDADGDPLTASRVSGPSHGTLALGSDGSFTYKPEPDYFGPDSFTYVAGDGQTNSAPATVTIVVVPVNDAPSFTAGPNQRVNHDAGPQLVTAWARNISPGPANESDQTVQFFVSSDQPSLFLVQPAINEAGDLSYTPIGNISGVATITVVARDTGGTDNGGSNESIPQTFAISLNGPPVVSIVNPTNQTIFVGTNSFTVVADASDPDGTVTNVLIFNGTNLIGSFTNAPYFVLLTNVPPSTNFFSAVVFDDLGLSATSTLVTVTVIQNPPPQALGPIALNLQTGLFEQRLRIFNPTPDDFTNGVRLIISNVVPAYAVRNATGTNAGVPFVDVHTPLLAGGFLDVLVLYFPRQVLVAPHPIVTVQPLSYFRPLAPAPIVKSIGPGDGFHFSTVANRFYYLQWSDDLVHWTTSGTAMIGTGDWMTFAIPSSGDQRFCRILLLP